MSLNEHDDSLEKVTTVKPVARVFRNLTPQLRDKRNRGLVCLNCHWLKFVSCRQKGKGSPYSIAERRVPELIQVLGSQPAGDVSHKPGGRLPLLSVRPTVTLTTLKRATTSFAA